MIDSWLHLRGFVALCENPSVSVEWRRARHALRPATPFSVFSETSVAKHPVFAWSAYWAVERLSLVARDAVVPVCGFGDLGLFGVWSLGFRILPRWGKPPPYFCEKRPFSLDGECESVYSKYTTTVDIKLRLTIMHDSHGSSREQAMAPVLSKLEFTHLLIERVLASMTGLGRRALEALRGRMVALPTTGGRVESVGTGGVGSAVIVSNKPNFPVSGLKMRGEMKNKANPCGREARYWGFRIADWGFGPPGHGMSNEPNLCATESRRARPALRGGRRNAGDQDCQTNPILQRPEGTTEARRTRKCM